jgi:hypothetical protein
MPFTMNSLLGLEVSTSISSRIRPQLFRLRFGSAALGMASITGSILDRALAAHHSRSMQTFCDSGGDQGFVAVRMINAPRRELPR